MSATEKGVERAAKATKYAVDWTAFDKAAQQRGAHRLSIERRAAPAVQPEPPAKRPGRGAQKKYSDETIHSMLMLSLAARMSLRETEGYVRALRDDAGYDWDVPDHSTLCRRMRELQVTLPPAKPGARLVFLVDSTGLKVSGPGEWRGRHARSGKEEASSTAKKATEEPAPAEAEKPKRRDWRKAHFAVEHGTGQIVAAVLTSGHADDAAQVPKLLAGQPMKGSTLCADGAYHEADIFQFVHEKGGQLLARAPYNAEPWLKRMGEPGIAWRNVQIGLRNELGQQLWAIRSGYSRRSLIETHNARFKLYTGSTMRSRHSENQDVELLMRAGLVNAYQTIWTNVGGTRARAIN